MSGYHAVQRWVLALAILGAAAQPAAAQDAASMLGRRVLSVRLVSEGREVRDPQVETIVEIRRGEPLTMTAVRETIVHVMSMGRFLDVRVDAEPSGDGVAVSLDLVPLRDIRRVVFRGELGVPERVLQAAVTDRFGATPAAGRSADIARTLEETLRDSGYLHATATSRPVGTSDTEAGDLVFEIACGVRARIRSLNYRGSPQPVVSDLQSHLPLREGDAYQPADLRKRLSTYTDAL
ncbi:MAG: hypothetical protein NTY02_17070, partial [Acidobacteria bacterium]|nr:hypothetical protein [Acidobacteriota bacterium]